MAVIPSLTRLTLDLPPSCIAFCPEQPQYFVVGTYFLHPVHNDPAGEVNDGERPDSNDDNFSVQPAAQEEQKRSGSLILFRLGDDGVTITELTTHDLPCAVLDIQWSPHASPHGSLLAVACSTGLIAFFRLQISQHGIPELIAQRDIPVAEPTTLVLHLAWHPNDPRIIGYTLSDGSVGLWECADLNLWTDHNIKTGLKEIPVHRHDLEAWFIAFSLPDCSAVLSGGDDAVLKSSSPGADAGEYGPLWQDRKIHQAGVTAILPLTAVLTVTGSYDDHIRLLAAPASGLGRRKVLAELDLGGGVWRLKVLTSHALPDRESTGNGDGISPITILASCMHAGTRVVRLSRIPTPNPKTSSSDSAEWQFEVLARFEEHESMNYGSDVQPVVHENGVKANPRTKTRTVISTSFYDKLMCLWRVELDN